jgi:hypothetical protein
MGLRAAGSRGGRRRHYDPRAVEINRAGAVEINRARRYAGPGTMSARVPTQTRRGPNLPPASAGW